MAFNCLYSAGTVLTLPEGPCADPYNGETLIDSFDLADSAQVTAVIPPAEPVPSSISTTLETKTNVLPWLLAIAAVLAIGLGGLEK